MCQLIEVTWFIWKLSADQLIVLLDREQCSISYFLASLGSEHRKTDTHIGHQCCDQLTAVKTRYLLTSSTWPYREIRCRPIEVKYCFEVIRWQGTGFQMIAGSSLIFFKKIFVWKKLCLCAAQLKFWFQTDLGRENSASCYRQGRQLLLTFLTMVTRWSRSTSNFLCSDWSKCDRWVHAENLCSILNLVYFDSWADIHLCQLLMFLTVFFHWMYKMKWLLCWNTTLSMFIQTLAIACTTKVRTGWTYRWFCKFFLTV